MIDRLSAAMAKKPEPRFENANMLRMFLSLVWKAVLGPEVCAPLSRPNMAFNAVLRGRFSLGSNVCSGCAPW